MNKELKQYLYSLVWKELTYEDKEKILMYFEKLHQKNTRLNKENKELKEDLEEYQRIGIMQFNRPYAKRYLEERRKEIPNLLYPDSEEIYIDYYDLKDKIYKIRHILNNQIDYREDRDIVIAIEEVIKSE